jgi:hypothetical protein
VPLKELDMVALRHRAQRAHTRTLADLIADAREQEAKRIWRVMAHNIKARLAAVEERWKR